MPLCADTQTAEQLRLVLAVEYLQQPYQALSNHERDMPFYGNSWSPFIESEMMRSHVRSR